MTVGNMFTAKISFPLGNFINSDKFIISISDDENGGTINYIRTMKSPARSCLL